MMPGPGPATSKSCTARMISTNGSSAAIGAAGGPTVSPIHWAFARLVGPRLEPPTATVDGESVRASDIAGAVTLGVASLLWIIGLGTLGWLLAIVVALVAIIAATTRIHLADLVLRRPPDEP